ncbi:hypothetical protein JCM10450v2_002662 [Rhodotorula kratochvilovae]
MASYYSAAPRTYARSPSPSPLYAPQPQPAPGPPPSAHGQRHDHPLRCLPPSHAHQQRQHTAPPSFVGGAAGAYTTAAPAAPCTERPHIPPHEDEPSSIRCSSCAAWVRLEDLGEHVCAPTPLLQQGRAPPPQGLRIDPRGGEGWAPLQGGARSPLYPGQHLQASPPGSAPHTPSGLTPPASAGGRLPFFDRYQKFVDTSSAGGGAAGNMAGVGAARSPRLAPAGLPFAPQRSPTSPLPTSVSAPNLSVPAQHAPYYPQTTQLAPHEPGPHRQHSPVSSRSGTSDSYASSARAERHTRAHSHRGQDTPESSVAASSSPRERKESLPSPSTIPAAAAAPLVAAAGVARAPSTSSSASSAYLPYDRAPLPQSRSTPADLASYAARAGAGDGLDACLEDLRLMAGEEEADGAEEMLEAFFDGRRRTDEYDAAPGAPGGGFTAEDLLATPRASPKREKKAEPMAAGLPARAPAPSSSPPAASLKPSSSSSSAPAALACSACRAPLPASSAPKRISDGPPFCRACYAARFLPKCRKCQLPIEGGAVTSSDGKITGKYHPRCFACFDCGADFPGGEFYVFNGKPYCQHDYHKHNGSLCANPACGKPIEGACVSLVGEENGGGGRYHPPCFNCAEPSCLVPLLSHHFVVDRLPYCDMHAAGPVRRRVPKGGSGAREGAEARAKKRMTIITRS